jgi:hypothetical protein
MEKQEKSTLITQVLHNLVKFVEFQIHDLRKLKSCFDVITMVFHKVQGVYVLVTNITVPNLFLKDITSSCSTNFLFCSKLLTHCNILNRVECDAS